MTSNISLNFSKTHPVYLHSPISPPLSSTGTELSPLSSKYIHNDSNSHTTNFIHSLKSIPNESCIISTDSPITHNSNPVHNNSNTTVASISKPPRKLRRSLSHMSSDLLSPSTGKPSLRLNHPNGIASRTHSFSDNSESLSSPPMKRKRGRPPKADSLTNRITTTMNININVSPSSNSPTAESNSNLITRRKNPDYYTSVLKVSPTSRSPSKRRSRKSSDSTLSSPLSQASPSKKFKSTAVSIGQQNDNLLVTPLSSAIPATSFTPYNQINSKTLDNISYITSSSNTNAYNTPPSSSIKTQFTSDNAPHIYPQSQPHSEHHPLQYNYQQQHQHDLYSPSKAALPTPVQSIANGYTTNDPSMPNASMIISNGFSHLPPPQSHQIQKQHLQQDQHIQIENQQVPSHQHSAILDTYNSNLLPPVSIVPHKSPAVLPTNPETTQDFKPSTKQQSKLKAKKSVKIKETKRTASPKKKTLADAAGQKQPEPTQPLQQEEPQPQQEIQQHQPQQQSGKERGFSLKLTIDDSGKAVLSNDLFTSVTPAAVGNNLKDTSNKRHGALKSALKQYDRVPDASIPSEGKSEDHIQSSQQAFKPRLTHANSVIGIEAQYSQHNDFVLGGSPAHSTIPSSPRELAGNVAGRDDSSIQAQPHQPNLLRRHNSDFTGINASSVLAAPQILTSINEGSSGTDTENSAPQGSGTSGYNGGRSTALPQLPQTPKVKENYLYSSTGLTPSSNLLANNLTFNLTPQFNSMMYSMMNINSPQSKRNTNNSQFLLNQDFFMTQGNAHTPSSSSHPHTINMTELMNMNSNVNGTPSSSFPSALSNSPSVTSKIGSEFSAPGFQSIQPQETLSSSSSSANDDAGDARSAFKKIVHVKKD